MATKARRARRRFLDGHGGTESTRRFLDGHGGTESTEALLRWPRRRGEHGDGSWIATEARRARRRFLDGHGGTESTESLLGMAPGRKLRGWPAYAFVTCGGRR